MNRFRPRSIQGWFFAGLFVIVGFLFMCACVVGVIEGTGRALGVLPTTTPRPTRTPTPKPSQTPLPTVTFTPGPTNTPEPTSTPMPEHSESMAGIMCEEFVKDSLKAPSTAEFAPFYDRNTTYLGDARYTVKSYVDAENAFGAKLRNYYVCTIKYIGSDRWDLEELNFITP